MFVENALNAYKLDDTKDFARPRAQNEQRLRCEVKAAALRIGTYR
jgi:hypothetical protein